VNLAAALLPLLSAEQDLALLRGGFVALHTLETEIERVDGRLSSRKLGVWKISKLFQRRGVHVLSRLRGLRAGESKGENRNDFSFLVFCDPRVCIQHIRKVRTRSQKEGAPSTCHDLLGDVETRFSASRGRSAERAHPFGSTRSQHQNMDTASQPRKWAPPSRRDKARRKRKSSIAKHTQKPKLKVCRRVRTTPRAGYPRRGRYSRFLKRGMAGLGQVRGTGSPWTSRTGFPPSRKIMKEESVQRRSPRGGCRGRRSSAAAAAWRGRAFARSSPLLVGWEHPDYAFQKRHKYKKQSSRIGGQDGSTFCSPGICMHARWRSLGSSKGGDEMCSLTKHADARCRHRSRLQVEFTPSTRPTTSMSNPFKN